MTTSFQKCNCFIKRFSIVSTVSEIQKQIQLWFIGLTDEMINSIGDDEELQYLIRLHHFVQKVKGSNSENSTKIQELNTLFTELHDIIGRVQRNQSKSANSAQDKKKEDQKKAKK